MQKPTLYWCCMQVGDKFNLVLATTINRDGAPESGKYDEVRHTSSGSSSSSRHPPFWSSISGAAIDMLAARGGCSADSWSNKDASIAAIAAQQQQQQE
jgi:hypothetical protein